MYCFKPEMCFDLTSSNCIKFPSTSSWPLIAKPCYVGYLAVSKANFSTAF